MGMTFTVIDKETGREVSERVIREIAKNGGLMEFDIDQFAVTEERWGIGRTMVAIGKTDLFVQSADISCLTNRQTIVRTVEQRCRR